MLKRKWLMMLLLLGVFDSPSGWAAPQISRLTPPSLLFSYGETQPPIISRFLPGQRFDLQATISPDPGQTIVAADFYIGTAKVSGPVSFAPATVAGLPAQTAIATRRAFSYTKKGVHQFKVVARQSNGAIVTATGNFEIVSLEKSNGDAKNIIVLIGDGMGIAHRTAARIMAQGIAGGKALGTLAMDKFPVTGIVMTHSLNSIVTDSSPGSSCYSSGNKANNNQHGVFPDDTTANFDNPRVELIGEYVARTSGKSLGIVTTSDVFDATPAAWATHTQSRAAGTGICDQYFDDRGFTGLSVLMGGGRKWFLPAGTPGSARSASNDYEHAPELYNAWGIARGAIDPARNLIADFQSAGFSYAGDKAALDAIPNHENKILGLFSFSNMNVAKDKIDGRRGASTIVNDYGFPNQPMLDEMTARALKALSRNKKGFVLMVEAASIDKQAHNMDTERWILDTIEFDRAIEVCRQFALKDKDTLVIVTADHECAGINIIGGSRVTAAELATRAASGGGAAQLRNGVVGTYEAAGFPMYDIAPDGYPVTADVDFKMLIGYAANADRYEDWLTNVRPLRDSQQPFNGIPPLSTYPGSPVARDTAGNFLVTGQIADSSAAHTASDVPVSALGDGAVLFTGVMDNTDVFFKIMSSVGGGHGHGHGHGNWNWND